MAKINDWWVLLFINCVQLIGLSLVLIGIIGEKKSDMEVTPVPSRVVNEPFPMQIDPANDGYKFPQEMAKAIHSKLADTFKSNVRYRGYVKQIVLLVVDAMRVDFLSDDKMPFVSKLLDASFGCIYKAKVKAPTVTLPRIKAIVSGDVSTYWDVIQNFKSQQILQDNIIWHAKKDHGKRLVFYGDDTWLKLFPKEFHRSEGVTSFFVSDFDQVDLNVTRKLNSELKSWMAWDMLILHYLGLDHIGHVHGPNSRLIPNKLLEMDEVVRKIYQFIDKNGPLSMIILCGDHGMANIGGHGGNSYNEVTTPLIFLSTRELKKCHNKDWRQLNDVPNVEQVDMAPTISALWGMMIPAQSAGKIIPDLLSPLAVSQQLDALYYNALHLRKFIQPDDKNKELMDEYSKVVEKHEEYVRGRAFLDTLTAARDENDLLESYTKLLHRLSQYASGNVGEQNLEMVATGTVLCVQAVFLIFNARKYQFHFCDVLVVPTVGLVIYYWTAYTTISLVIVNLYLILKCGMELPDMSFEYSYVGNYGVSLFYFASSFVEEEHMLRYYLWAAALASLFFMQTELPPPAEPVISSSVDEKTVPSPPAIPALTSQPARILMAMFLHRLAIDWNQTGQKWTHLVDLVDLLKNYNLVPWVALLSICWLYYLRRKRCHYFHAFSLLAIWLIKAGFLNYISSGMISNEAQFGYVLIVLDLCVSLKWSKSLKASSVLNSWILFSMLIHRHENLPLIPIIIYQLRLTSKVFQEYLPSKDVNNWSTRHIYLLWFSLAAFYYQGNSNNIASIDVNAGYTGLDSYNEILVGLLIFCNTFSAPMLIFLAFLEEKGFEDLKKAGRTRERFMTLSFLNIVTKTNVTSNALYCIVIWAMRNHLFVWTVFTPKLLYTIAFTAFYTIVIIMYAVDKILSTSVVRRRSL